jgi:hypothetical protein
MSPCMNTVSSRYSDSTRVLVHTKFAECFHQLGIVLVRFLQRAAKRVIHLSKV